MKIEVWRNVIGYEGYYEVSNQGRVRSLSRTVLTKRGRKQFYKGRMMVGTDNGVGYKKLALSKGGKQKYFYIHQLVAMTFLNHTPDGHTLVVDHINGVKTDNNVDNLRIVSNRDNTTTCHRKDRNSLSSNFAGVCYHKLTNKWQAGLKINGKRIYLGVHTTELEAYQAILEYEAIQPIIV